MIRKLKLFVIPGVDQVRTLQLHRLPLDDKAPNTLRLQLTSKLYISTGNRLSFSFVRLYGFHIRNT